MTEVYSAALMKESDAYTVEHKIPARELMLRAGKRIFEKINKKGPVAVVCGSGNNAGDGFVIASLFHSAGEDVTVYLLSEKTSESGEYYLNECREKGVRIITITENLDSPLAAGADVVLKQHVNRETDRYNCQGTTSSTSLAVIFHVLQTMLIEETGFRNEQFALIHPGGAVGERLNRN